MALDELDAEILKILQNEGRFSDRAVARKTGSTAPTVARRIKRLKDLGVIQGFSVDLNPNRLDLITVLARGIPQGDTTEIIAQISEFNYLSTIDLTSSGEIWMRFEFQEMQDSVELQNWLEEICHWDSMEIEESSRQLEKRREIVGAASITLECAFCGQRMKDARFLMKWQGRIYPCCCHICERNLTERLKRLEEMRSG